MNEELFGYRGAILKILRDSGVQIGDEVKVIKVHETFEGVLMPRYELADDSHLVIKLRNGYNIGIEIISDAKIEKMGIGIKPTFISSQPIEDRKLPAVAVISTGGTIASRVDYRTGAVRPALTTNDLFSVVPELSEIANLRAEVLYTILSENVFAFHWKEIAKKTAKYIEEKVEGVVICHGTDTMGYTSAALSFALQNLPVPVILVGSQRSSDRPSSDGTMNLIHAVKAAVSIPIAEVMVGMHETIEDTTTVLHRGTKVRKLHTSRRDAFKSINASPLARVEADKWIAITKDYKKRDSKKKVILKPDFEEKVALIEFFPGLNPKVIEWYADEGYRGLILEGTGLGHVSSNCFSTIQKIVDKGLFVGMCSQCLYGRVNMKVYDTGRDLLKIGVTPLEDMLPETAYVKLSWTLGQTKNEDDVKKIMITDIAGEISTRSVY